MVVNVVTSKTVFKGVIKEHIGDFSALNPKGTDEFVIKDAEEDRLRGYSRKNRGT